MSKQEHVQAATDLVKVAGIYQEAWSELVNHAALTYGDGNGSLISGVYRDHYPDHIKDALRTLAHARTAALDASARQWGLSRRHMTTWRRMFAEMESL